MGVNPAAEMALDAADHALKSITVAKYVHDDELYWGISEAICQITEAWMALGGALNMDGEIPSSSSESYADHIDRQVHDQKDGLR